ncbi:MAG: DUF2203 family protein [Bacillota bacterium]|nr:DUF2203 family protein [Bacillota bacterium]
MEGYLQVFAEGCKSLGRGGAFLAKEESSSRSSRLSLQEANALLPQLRELVDRLQAIHQEVQEQFVQVERMRLRGYSKDGNVIYLFQEDEARGQIQRLVAEGNRIIRKMQAMGCEILDIEEGLVDMPGELSGKPVMFLWSREEPWVMYYHDVKDGVEARKRVPLDVN